MQLPIYPLTEYVSGVLSHSYWLCYQENIPCWNWRGRQVKVRHADNAITAPNSVHNALYTPVIRDTISLQTDSRAVNDWRDKTIPFIVGLLATNCLISKRIPSKRCWHTVALREGVNTYVFITIHNVEFMTCWVIFNSQSTGFNSEVCGRSPISRPVVKVPITMNELKSICTLFNFDKFRSTFVDDVITVAEMNAVVFPPSSIVLMI